MSALAFLADHKRELSFGIIILALLLGWAVTLWMYDGRFTLLRSKDDGPR